MDNLGDVFATNVVLSDLLPASLSFVASGSSPLCADLGGGLVECYLLGMNPGASAAVTVTAQALFPEQVSNTVEVKANECEVYPPDNVDTVQVLITDAQACDANGSGAMDTGDPVAAAAHIFGDAAAGNPDCNQDGVVDAEDLAKIIEEVDLQRAGKASRADPDGESR